MKIHFNNSPIRSEQGIYVEFDNYDSNIYSGGYVEIAPPFGAKAKKTLTSESVYRFSSEDKSLLSNLNNVAEDCDLESTETVYKGDFKLGSYVVNIENAGGLISSFTFLILEPKINIDYLVNVSNSTCELFDKTNYKINNVLPTTKFYDLKFTAPAVKCNETNKLGKTYTAPETWNSGSLIYINNRATKSVASTEDDRFLVTPIYDTTYYIRYESEFTYNFLADEITSTDDGRATATTKSFSEPVLIAYDTGKVTMGMPVGVQSPTQLSCDIWDRIKDIDTKYKDALCKNTILADKLRDILDRALQLYLLSTKATEIGNEDLALMYLNQMVDLTKTRIA
tara:strand:- start:1392 stop:2408 length:1017 start_codon:yes stop_codon:yes gene_type:complete